MAKSKSDISLNDLKAMLPQAGNLRSRRQRFGLCPPSPRRIGTSWLLCRSLPSG